MRIIHDSAGRELCPSCAPDTEEVNHPVGMIFIGWGCGWQPCQTCGGSGLAETTHCKDFDMNIPNIVDLAKETASFVRYQDKALWYRIDKLNFEFPIPVDDSGGGTFNPTEKGLTLMRWIRKHVTLLTEALDKQGAEE